MHVFFRNFWLPIIMIIFTHDVVSGSPKSKRLTVNLASKKLYILNPYEVIVESKKRDTSKHVVPKIIPQGTDINKKPKTLIKEKISANPGFSNVALKDLSRQKRSDSSISNDYQEKYQQLNLQNNMWDNNYEDSDSEPTDFDGQKDISGGDEKDRLQWNLETDLNTPEETTTELTTTTTTPTTTTTIITPPSTTQSTTPQSNTITNTNISTTNASDNLVSSVKIFDENSIHREHKNEIIKPKQHNLINNENLDNLKAKNLKEIIKQNSSKDFNNSQARPTKSEDRKLVKRKEGSYKDVSRHSANYGAYNENVSQIPMDIKEMIQRVSKDDVTHEVLIPGYNTKRDAEIDEMQAMRGIKPELRKQWDDYFNEGARHLVEFSLLILASAWHLLFM